MTPLIDVVFQLLIFFVCTVEFSTREDILQARLPASDKDAQARQQTTEELDLGRIDIDVSNKEVVLRFQGKSTEIGKPESAEALEELRHRLREWVHIDPKIPVRIRCQPDAATGTMVRVYDACLQAGAADVGLTPPADQP
jgi:biopolymer transport protein ExbD